MRTAPRSHRVQLPRELHAGTRGNPRPRARAQDSEGSAPGGCHSPDSKRLRLAQPTGAQTPFCPGNAPGVAVITSLLGGRRRTRKRQVRREVAWPPVTRLDPEEPPSSASVAEGCARRLGAREAPGSSTCCHRSASRGVQRPARVWSPATSPSSARGHTSPGQVFACAKT